MAYFEKFSLGLDKNSNRLTTAVENVLCRINRQKLELQDGPSK